MGQAQNMKVRVQKMMKKEDATWGKQFFSHFIVKRKQLEKKQVAEMNACLTRNEEFLNQKIRKRDQELQKMLKRFQNLKNELEIQHNQLVSNVKCQSDKKVKVL